MKTIFHNYFSKYLFNINCNVVHVFQKINFKFSNSPPQIDNSL